MSITTTFRFGEFELDLRQRELRCGPDVVRLQPRVFALLAYLVANPDRAISRDELFEGVWDETSVSDGSLSRAVRALRAALARDPGLADAIQTVRGFGYRFSPRADPGSVGESSRLLADGSEPPLVSREAAFGQIAQAFDGVARGERQTIWIEGEPGTGKTSLARWALDQAPANFVLGVGQCIEGFGEKSPYLPVLEALSHAAHSGGKARKTRLLEWVARAAPNWRGHLPLLFPDASVPTEPIQPHAQMARELLDAVDLIARDAPLVLLIEDVQWADESSIELIESISKRTLSLPLLVLCTARRSETNTRPALQGLRAEANRAGHGTRIEMTPLSTEGIRVFTAWRIEQAGAAPGAAPGALVDWLAARTGGHPLFLVQLLDHLDSLGLLADWTGDADQVEGLEQAGLPETLGQLLTHWIRGLDEQDRHLLEAASVAGFHFDLRTVEAALGWEEGAAEESCDRSCSLGWLAFRDFSTWPDGTRGTRLRFGHGLYAEALYASIAPVRRGRFHEAIARRLETGHLGQPAASNEIAEHFERAGALEAAARHRIHAARFAASRQSSTEALALGESAFRLLSHLPEEERVELETDLCLSVGTAVSLREGFGSDRGRENFERAQQLAAANGDVAREAAAVWGLSSCWCMRGEIERARLAGERLRVLAAKDGEPRFELLAVDVLCNIAYFQGRFADCIAQRDAALAIASDNTTAGLPVRSLQDIQANAHAYGALAEWHLGREPDAARSIQESLKLAREIARPQTEAVAEAFAAILHELMGDPDGQRKHAARGRAISEAADVGLWREIAQFMEVCADPPSLEALPTLEALLGGMGQYGGLGGTYFIGLLARWESELGNHEKAQAICRLGIETAGRTGEVNNLPVLHLIAAGIAEADSERGEHLAQARAAAEAIQSLALQRMVSAWPDRGPGR